MKTYAIYAKDDIFSKIMKTHLESKLTKYIQNKDTPDMVISIGGDGTMLAAIHQYIDKDVFPMFVGINTGTLGFLTDYLGKEIDALIRAIESNVFDIQTVNLLDITLDKGDTVQHLYALNEVRIENNVVAQRIEVAINEEHLESFRGNGLCICTPIGSTAYNKSLGGAIIDSGIPAMQLSEVAGIHHNAYRSLGSPLVLGEGYNLKLVPIKGYNPEGMVIGVDRLIITGEDVKAIEVCVSSKKVSFIHFMKASFTSRLRRGFIQE